MFSLLCCANITSDSDSGGIVWWFGQPLLPAPQEVQQNTLKVKDTMRDLETTIRGTEDVRADIFEKVKQNLFLWKKTVLVEKSVYDVLNQLSFKGQTVVAECWSPKEDLDNVQRALVEAEKSSGAQVVQRAGHRAWVVARVERCLCRLP